MPEDGEREKRATANVIATHRVARWVNERTNALVDCAISGALEQGLLRSFRKGKVEKSRKKLRLIRGCSGTRAAEAVRKQCARVEGP